MMHRDSAFRRIWSDAQLAETGFDASSWQSRAVAAFRARVGEEDFPCLFGRKALKSGSLCYLFCGRRSGAMLIDFLIGLLEYTQFVRETPAGERLYSPLIVFFADELHEAAAMRHALGWEALNWLHRFDPLPWPRDIPLDAHEPNWCFCFNGVQLFINMSSAGHRQLRSRDLGSELTLVINPRENFDLVASAHTRSGRLVRENIRSRIARYNDGYVPRELGFYGESGNLEWTQYQLAEEALPRPAGCPFRAAKQDLEPAG